MKKRILKIFLSLALALLLLYGLLHLAPVRNLVLEYAAHRIEAATGAVFHADTLEYNLLQWRFTLKNLTLAKKDENHRKLPVFFKARQVTVDIPSPLSWKKAVHLEDVSISEPEIRLIILPDGKSNFPFTSRQDPEAAQAIPPFLVKHLGIENARFLYHDQTQGIKLEAPGITVSLNWLRQDSHTLSLEMREKGTVQIHSQQYPIDGLTLQTVLDNNDINVTGFAVQSGRNRIDAKGMLKNYGAAAPEMDIETRLTVFSEDVSPLLPQLRGVPGEVSIAARFLGPVAKPKISARIIAKDFILPSPLDAAVTGEAEVSLNGYTTEQFKGKGKLQFLPLHPLPHPTPPALHPGKTLEKNLPLRGTVSFDAQPGTLNLDIHALTIAGAVVEGQLTVKDQDIQGTLQVDVPALGTSLRNIRRAGINKEINRIIAALLNTGIDGNGVFNFDIEGTPGSPRVTARIRSRLWVKDVNPVELEGTLKYTTGVLRIETLDSRQGRSHLNISGIVPLSSPRAVKKPSLPLQFTVRGENIDTSAIQPLVEGEIPIRGDVSVAAQIEIDPGKNRLNAEVEHLEITSGDHVLSIQQPFRLVLEPTVLSVENLEITAPGTLIRVNGDLPLTANHIPGSRPLSITADMDSRLIRLFIPGLEAEGLVKIQGDITGSLARPEITGQLTLTGGKATLSGIPGTIDNITFHLGMPGDKIVIDNLSCEWRGVGFSLKGAVPFSSLGLSAVPVVPAVSAEPTASMTQSASLEEAENISLSLAIRGVSAQLLETYLPPDWTGKISGTLEADVELQGKRFSLEELSGTAEIREIQAAIDGFPIRQQEPVRIRLAKGIITLENLALSGPDTFVNGTGTLELNGKLPVHARLAGEINSRILNGFGEDIAFSGINALEFRVEGDMSAPQFSGEIEIREGGMQHLFHHLYISGLNGKINIANDRIYTEAPLVGNFNGGQIKVSLVDGGWNFAIQRAQVEIPWGLLSTVSGNLTLAPLPGNKGYKLQGSIPVTNSSYTEAFGLNSRLYRYMRQLSVQPVVQTTDTEATPIEFNVRIYTETPIRVENNMAKADISAAFTLTGTDANPLLAGRAEIKEGGEIILGKNTFYIERGTINLVNPYRVEPELDISARTRVAETDIRLNINGPVQALSATLSSTPSLPESHIIALLVSGKPVESTSPTALSTVGNKTLSYLESTLSGKVEQAVKQTLGLETVRIDGSLVAAKENPSARLTLGHHLATNLEVIMSQSLRQSQDRTWIVNYNPLPGVNLQGARQDNNAYTLGLNHEVHFGLKGGEPSSASLSKKAMKNSAPKIREIVITGDMRLPETEIRKRLTLKKGKPFRFFQLQQDIRRIKKVFYKKHYLNAEVISRKEEVENKIDKKIDNKVKVILEVEAGPQVFLEFRGAPVSNRFRKKAKQTWIDNHFDEQRQEAVLRQLQLYFFKKGEVLSFNEISPRDISPGNASGNTPRNASGNVPGSEPSRAPGLYNRGEPGVRVETVSEGTGVKRVIFHIRPGLRFKKLRLRYTGNHYRPAPMLSRLLKQAKLVPFVLNQPEKVTRYLEQWYRQEGFLAAVVASPVIHWNKEKREVTAEMPIDEGPRYRVGEVSVEGNRFLSASELESTLKAIKSGDFFYPPKIMDTVAAVETMYAHKGFYNARVTVKQHVDKTAQRVDMSFVINENSRSRITGIRYQGNRVTREKTIRRELLFKTGDLLDLKALNESRKKLYDLAVFRRVNLDLVPTGEIDPETGEQAGVIEVQVSERQPFQLKYGLQLDTEAGIGTAGELLNVNSGGRALLLGTSFRYNRLEQEARVFGRVPYFLGKRLNTEFYLFFNRKKETQAAEPVQRFGITLQQQLKLGRKSLLSYGYTFERYRGEKAVNLGHLTASLTFDTRDSFWNAERGVLVTQSFQYAGKLLGSEVEFSRYLGQFNFYRRLTPRLVSASSLHVGLGNALGQELLPGERFFAGGITTVRGFKYNSVGPIDPETLEPVGGEALFLFKQEMRYRLIPNLSTVIFLDIGNVYPTVSAFNPFDTREAAGVGLRFNFYGILLRVDWGFKLDRRRGESLSRIFFSIGQSF